MMIIKFLIIYLIIGFIFSGFIHYVTLKNENIRENMPIQLGNIGLSLLFIWLWPLILIGSFSKIIYVIKVKIKGGLK